ncbi:hypothetical protein MHYP_G00102780 [Metynnis hypsauchen]
MTYALAHHEVMGGVDSSGNWKGGVNLRHVNLTTKEWLKEAKKRAEGIKLAKDLRKPDVLALTDKEGENAVFRQRSRPPPYNKEPPALAATAQIGHVPSLSAPASAPDPNEVAQSSKRLGVVPDLKPKIASEEVLEQPDGSNIIVLRNRTILGSPPEQRPIKVDKALCDAVHPLASDIRVDIDFP